jgi:hypothetical protein
MTSKEILTYRKIQKMEIKISEMEQKLKKDNIELNLKKNQINRLSKELVKLKTDFYTESNNHNKD